MLKGKVEARYWIRDLWRHPGEIEGEDWLFWQFTDRGRVDGIQGFVDLNGSNEGAVKFMNRECRSMKKDGPESEAQSPEKESQNARP